MAVNDNERSDPAPRQAPGQYDRNAACHPLDEPLVFRCREDRTHDVMVVGFLVVLLSGAAIGLIATIVALLPMQG